MTHPELIPYDLGDDPPLRMSERALASVLRALIHVNGQMVDSYLSSGGYATPGWDTVMLRVLIPSGREGDFQRETGLWLMPPPRGDGAG